MLAMAARLGHDLDPCMRNSLLFLFSGLLAVWENTPRFE